MSNRREFLKSLSRGSALVPVVAVFSSQLLSIRANAQNPPEAVKESDPTAQALGYKADASKVDTKKFPKKAGADGKSQMCRTCSFYQGKSADAKTAPCTIFAGKLVNSGGWCNSWAKKA